MALAPYQNRLKNLRSRLQNPQYQDRIPRIQNRINKVRTKAGLGARDWTNWKPKYQTTTPTETPTTTPTEENIVEEYWPGLQPDAATTGPATEVTDYTASPLYEWQRKQAQLALDKQLSARGLYDSGAGLQANQDMMQQLLASEVERQQKVQEWKYKVAAENADRQQAASITNANRLWDILASEQARRDTLGQNQFTNKMTLLDWISEQNPMKYVAGSLTDSAGMKKELAKYAADYMSQMYPQLFMYLQNIIPPFYATGSSGTGSMASQAE